MHSTAHQHILQKQSDGINKSNAENDEITNDLDILQKALEQIKSYNDNLYFQSIAQQFECRLNESEMKTLQYLTQQNEDSNDCPFIFYKGFKQWYIDKYIGMDNKDNISNTARSETLFTGTESEEILHQNIFQNNINDDDEIYQIWQTILGIENNKKESKQILGKRNAFIDVTKHIHFETTKDKILKSSLIHLCVVNNHIFKIELTLHPIHQTTLFHIININIFKLIASILWEPKLAANIINVCALHTKKKPQTFEEAFEMESAKRLSQHKRAQSSKIDLPDIPDTPSAAPASTKDSQFEYNEEEIRLKNMSIDVDDEENEVVETPSTKLGLHGQDKTRGSFNMDDDNGNNAEDDDAFFDHQGRHESYHSNECILDAVMIVDVMNQSDDENVVSTTMMMNSSSSASSASSSSSLHTEYQDNDTINAPMDMISEHGSYRSTDMDDIDIQKEIFGNETFGDETTQSTLVPLSLNDQRDTEEYKIETVKEKVIESDEDHKDINDTNEEDGVNAVMQMIDSNNSKADTEIQSYEDAESTQVYVPSRAPSKAERQGTMVEYDVDNILSGDPAIASPKSESEQKEEDEITPPVEQEEETTPPPSVPPLKPGILKSRQSQENGDDEKDEQITPPPQILKKKTIEIDKNTKNIALDLNALPTTPQPMNLSKSSPMMNNWSENITLHGYYSNASSDEERWTRLKKRVHRHWDEDVVDQMKAFCEENDFSFADILDDIADSMDDFDNSNIISHLKDELHWNEAKTLRFYRTLRRILISRQSTQFNGSMPFALGIGNIHMRNLSDNVDDNIQIDMNPMRIRRSQSEVPNGVPSLVSGKHSHEIRKEKAWFNVEQSLLRKKWGHEVLKEFKSLCEEEEFTIPLIIDDIGCFEDGASMLMDPLKNRLNWNEQTQTKFVEDLRVALTKDLQEDARMSRVFKRAELSFQRTDSFSLSDSKTPILTPEQMPSNKDKFNFFESGSDILNVPRKSSIRKMTQEISKNESPKLGPLKDDDIALPLDDVLIEINPFSPPQNTPPPMTPPAVNKYSTIDSTVSIVSNMSNMSNVSNASMNTIKSVDIGDQAKLCNEWKQKHGKYAKEQMFEQSQRECGCGYTEECPMYTRLMFVMEFYMSWILINQTENHDINPVDMNGNSEEIYHQISIYTFLSKLENYSSSQLWNDYFHLRTFHTNTNNWNDFTQICMADTCKILSRYHRNRELSKDNETRLEMYNIKETDQTNEVITQQLLDMIHCTIFHPIFLMHTNNDNDNDNGLRAKIVDSALYNDKLRKIDRMKRHKFLTSDDRMASNHHLSFDQNDEETLKAKKKSNKLKQDKTTNSAFRILPGLNKQKNEWKIFLSLNSKTLEQYSKYQEFRQEILDNDIHKISAEQWTDCWKRAELFKTTWKGKALQSKRSLPGFRVRKGDPIPTHYIMALMLWSNFDLLQYEFRLHAKQIQMQTSDDNEDESRRKFQFCRWGFWLKASVDCFGQRMEKNETYFHCFAKKMIFNEMWINFVYPTSISKSFLITQIYSNNECNSDGIILALNRRDHFGSGQSQIPFIDCSYISDFGYEEEERLIFNGWMDIKCADFKLTHYRGFEYYIPHFFALKWWDIMTNVGKYKYFHGELGDEKEKILIELLSSMHGGKNNTNYVQQIFVNLCQRDFLDINLRLLDELLLSPVLKEHFIDSKDGRVDFWRLIKLFPNATKFSIRLQKGIELGAFICEKFLKIIDRWNKVSKSELKLNRVILSSDKKNKNLSDQTKHLTKAFGSRSWVIFFNKPGNKVKFENNHNFAKH